MACACICPHRSRFLADRCGAYCGHLCKRGRCFKLRRAFRHSERQLRGRHGFVLRGASWNRLRFAQCVLPYGLLPAVYSMCRCARHDTQGIKQLGLDGFYCFLPACRGLDRNIHCLPYRSADRLIFIKEIKCTGLMKSI